MGRKRKKSESSDEWEPFECVGETQDPDGEECKSEPDTWEPFETVAETEDQSAVQDVAPELSRLDLQPAEQDPSLYKLKTSTKDVHSSVICKLTRVLRLPELLPKIKRLCVVMKQIQLEGWHLANLHVLRYWAHRDDVRTYASETVVNGGSMINEMAKLMSINALNMIALHFRRRLHQYVRFRYAPDGKPELKYRDTKRLVDSCFRVKMVPETDDDGNATGNMVKDWTQWDDTTDPVEKELRAWLQIVPWQWQIRANSAHFIRKLYDMLTFMEKFVEKHPKQKGARVYSLLPVATSYQAAYIKLNATTLYGLFAQSPEPKVKEFLKNELNIVPTKERTDDSQLPFSRETFQNHKTVIMRKVFDVTQFETSNRKFVDEVRTNGYGASVTMKRPVTTTSVIVVQKKEPRKKNKTNDGSAQSSKKKKPKKKKVKTPEELAEGNNFAKELFKLGPDYRPDVLIGIDPGMRSLVTAAIVGRVKKRRSWRRLDQRGRRQRRQEQRRKKRVVEISTREYRHLARMNDFRMFNERLKQREPWYAGVVQAMPSFSYDAYLHRLQFFWMHVRFLLAFSAEQPFLRWRFTKDRAKMTAIDALAKRLVPKASKNVCIAYGDWSRRDGIKGHATGPVKGFVKALQKRATVVPMDEYRTSITCSSCHQRLKPARLFNKLKRKEDDEDIRSKENPSKKEVKEIAEMRKFRNPKLADKKIVLKCTRNVLRCVNSRCGANFWNRDVNAACNMLELLRSGLKGKRGARRLRGFRRGQ